MRPVLPGERGACWTACNLGSEWVALRTPSGRRNPVQPPHRRLQASSSNGASASSNGAAPAAAAAAAEPAASQPGLLLPAGGPGAWDEAGVGQAVVRYYLGDDEQRWFMWYTGRSAACQSVDDMFPSSGSIGGWVGGCAPGRQGRQAGCLRHCLCCCRSRRHVLGLLGCAGGGAR